MRHSHGLWLVLPLAAAIVALVGPTADARPVNWTVIGEAEVQDIFGNPAANVPVHLEAYTRYNIRQEGGEWTYDLYECSADGVTDAQGRALLQCENPWEFAEQGDGNFLRIADTRYNILERHVRVQTAHEISLSFVAAFEGMELPLAQKFAPKLVLTAGDLGVRPSPVEIMDRNGDGRLGWEDALVQVYTVAGNFVGEFRPDEILFDGGDHFYPGQYQYPYFHFVMKYPVIPGYHIEGDRVIPHNPYAIYILVPHFEWGRIGETNGVDWYGTYQQVQAAHAGDSRYTKGVTYAHLFTDQGEIILQYWFFYPFNYSGNRHEGDWEHINVVLDSGKLTTARILRVEYYFHQKVIVARSPGVDYEVVDETHPLVYVGGYTTDQPCSTLEGYGTHGSYPRPGRIDNINQVGSFELVGGDGLHIDFDGYRNIVLLPKDLPRTVYVENPELTYTLGWQHFAAGWGHPLSQPLPCDHAPFLDTIFSIIDKIPLGKPFHEVAKFIVFALFTVGQDVFLEDTNKAPVGPRYNTRWETTSR